MQGPYSGELLEKGLMLKRPTCQTEGYGADPGERAMFSGIPASRQLYNELEDGKEIATGFKPTRVSRLELCPEPAEVPFGGVFGPLSIPFVSKSFEPQPTPG